MNSTGNEQPPSSPCVSICLLNVEDICTGCYRSGAEIRDWMSLDHSERRQILLRASARRREVNPFG
ncbi:MAG: DUF1289 domain-containing protein [Porticoccaceae bacterium]